MITLALSLIDVTQVVLQKTILVLQICCTFAVAKACDTFKEKVIHLVSIWLELADEPIQGALVLRQIQVLHEIAFMDASLPIQAFGLF